MGPQRRDWTPLIVLGVAGSVALAGSGFLGGYTVGYMQHKPVVAVTTPTPEPTATPSEPATPTASPTPTSSPTPSPTAGVDCYQFGDFPYYPGSLAVAASTQNARAWHVYAPASQVAGYYANGASQLAWQFRLASAIGSRWTYRISRAPSCRGSLVVSADPAGGTLYQATPDS